MRSLSNLYKQWYIQPQTTEARVIDSNPLVDSYLARNALHTGQPGAAEEGGFVEGLAAADTVEPDTPESRIDYVALAKTEAVRIIEEAKQQAEDLLAQADARAAELKEEAKQEGYQSAEAMIESEREEIRRSLEAAYQERNDLLEHDYAARRDQMEAELVDVILNVFDRVFHIQFDGKKEMLLNLVSHTLMNIGDEKHFRVRVAAAQVAFLEKRRAEILDQIGHDIELDILPDTSMKENDCVIETDSGVFDCGLDTQLENLIRDIRSLCS